MSYESTNQLPNDTRIKDVLEFIELLNYRRVLHSKLKVSDEVAEYYFFEENEYKSWSGIDLSVFRKKSEGVVVYTRTNVSRSYYDLTHQNHTIRTLKRRFGGSFETDEGKGRYLHPRREPPLPQESGCYLAFQRFGSNLIKADIYLQGRVFPNKQWEKTGILEFMDASIPDCYRTTYYFRI
jgi:hypothetical protein